MKKTFLLGKFWNPDDVMTALGKLRDQGVQAYDVYSPFPIHNIEPLLDIKRTRLSVACFIYGCIGALTGFTLMSLLYGAVWPMNIGGKPAIPVPSFAPVTFEMTILFAAHGVIITFFIVQQYFPGKKAELMDIRQTDDVFVIAIDQDRISGVDQTQSISNVFTANGAFEVTEKTFE
ncbi:MAG: DUF3341 domain-containing protein [Bacteroidota bacterium]